MMVVEILISVIQREGIKGGGDLTMVEQPC